MVLLWLSQGSLVFVVFVFCVSSLCFVFCCSFVVCRRKARNCWIRIPDNFIEITVKANAKTFLVLPLSMASQPCPKSAPKNKRVSSLFCVACCNKKRCGSCLMLASSATNCLWRMFLSFWSAFCVLMPGRANLRFG